jgi:hypothetical protein
VGFGNGQILWGLVFFELQKWLKERIAFDFV